MSEILERMNKVFQVVFGNDELVITEKTSADDIDGWDSLRHVSLLSMLEDEFHIEFDIDEIVSMENAGDMLKVIESRI